MLSLCYEIYAKDNRFSQEAACAAPGPKTLRNYLFLLNTSNAPPSSAASAEAPELQPPELS